MKAITLILAGTIGLVGCTSIQPHHGADTNYDSHYNDPKSESYVQRLNNNEVKVLTKFGILKDDTMFLRVVNKNGEGRILIDPNNVRHVPNVSFPIKNVNVTDFGGTHRVVYEKSHCLLWSDGSSGSSGGAAIYGSFCLIQHQ